MIYDYDRRVAAELYNEGPLSEDTLAVIHTEVPRAVAGLKKFEAERAKFDPETVTDKEEKALSLLLNREVFKHVQTIWMAIHGQYARKKGLVLPNSILPPEVVAFVSAKDTLKYHLGLINMFGFGTTKLHDALEDLKH